MTSEQSHSDREPEGLQDSEELIQTVDHHAHRENLNAMSEISNVCEESEKPQENYAATEVCETRKECRSRTRTQKGLNMDLEMAKKRYTRAENTLKRCINRVDELLRESADLANLTAGKDGLELSMTDLKLFHETVIELQMKLGDEDSLEIEYGNHARLLDAYLECLADVKTRINDKEIERAELISQRSSSSTRSKRSRVSRGSAASKHTA